MKRNKVQLPSVSIQTEEVPAVSCRLPEKNRCTGCGACEAACSLNAITMQEGMGGFLYPVINSSLCTQCGECTNRCPVLTPDYRNEKRPACYAVQAEPEQREVSASGGFAAVLSAEFIAGGGYVCGAAFVNALQVQHTIIHEAEELEQLSGVKYTQSMIPRSMYHEIRTLLTRGEKVLFIGCPCQVAGVLAFLGRDYPELYTLDIACSGVVSEKIMQQYLKETFPEQEAAKISYRNKKRYGWSSSMTIEFTDGTEFREKCKENFFYAMFQSDYSIRPSCGNCMFAKLPRQGDLTCGDLWSVSRFHEEWSDKKGTSFVTVNSPKGEKLCAAVQKALPLYEQIPLSEASHGNRVLTERPPRPELADRFLAGVGRVPLRRLLKSCMQKTYDAGIVGLWYGLNYGSVLTYYALYRVLYDMGYDPLLIDKPTFLWSPRYADHNTLAHRFIRRHCNVSKRRVNAEDWRIQGEQCDTFIIGSDVVWNYEICGRSSGNYLFLDFVPDNKRKLAYAASFGGGYNAPEWLARQNRYYIRKFDGISVREDAAVNLCKKHFGVAADKVLDPVFLCDMRWFNEAADDSRLVLPERYLASYILGASEKKRAFIQAAAKQLGCEMFNVVNPNEPEQCRKIMNLPTVKDPTVEDWLHLIRDCTLYIGDSFHGLCFSILFRRRFVCIIRKDMPSRDRFETLLRICGLEDRLLYMEQDNTSRFHLLEEDIDYDEVERRLEPLRQESMTWLRTHMEQPLQALHADTPEELEQRLSTMQYEIYALQRELEALRQKHQKS
ncbi:MAG: polysaccharide pyruvyl transferase family protein [Oscillospiraceae bacterium]|nr:polysaccharide pyruvyl transferase family protein [Ruminococcus sp.]MBQ9110124.1 polysaccharide pyruvyl transferase family protein [Oscillospiraceae bacterium]